MRAEILMIGTELLLGQIHDTNATWLAQTLAQNGIHLRQKTTVGDNLERICGALEAALSRCDVVVCSGGLGPTEDDITRECVARVLGREMAYRETLFESVRARFAHLNVRISENNKRQATLPVGAEAIDNPNGTAPGVLVEDPRGTIICLPGPPHELQAMVETAVLPYLRARFGLQGVVHYRELKVCGLGESRIDEYIGDLVRTAENPTVGLLAKPDAVHVRIAAFADDVDAANALIEPVAAQVHERMPGLIMGQDGDTLEGVIDAMLHARGWRMATQEAVSGGMLAHRLTAGGAGQYVGGSVEREAVDSEAAALDVARRCQLSYGVECALVVAGDDPAKRCWASAITPEHEAAWHLTYLGSGARLQLRLAIQALERFRRLLAALATPEQ